MPPDDINTKERVIPGENNATRSANADAVALTGATAGTDPFYCPQSPFEQKIRGIAQGYKDSDEELKSLMERDRNGTLDDVYFFQKDSEGVAHARGRLEYLQSLPMSEWLAGKGASNPSPAYRLTGWEFLNFRGPHESMSHLELIENANSQMEEAKKAGDLEKFQQLCKQKNEINEKTSTEELNNRKMVMVGLMAAMPMPGGGGPRMPRMPRNAGTTGIKPGTGRGIFTRSKPPTQTTPQANAIATGEPVSVANGEYLETWRDFLVPGTFAFNGARYMGLKLGLPVRYRSPLGACQISMFDEIFSNPERGQLVFHDSEGKRIWFQRPFNFLPAINAGYPHLELKAPWLKQLTLKDRHITKHFRQYADGFYRLEKIADLNGFELVLTRTIEGLMVRADGPDGLSLAFKNDAKGRRTKITLIGTDSSEQELALYAYDPRGRMISADCVFGMSVRYQWQEANDLLASWHDVTRASETHFTYDEDGRVVHTATSGIWNDDRFDYAQGETAYLPGGNAAAVQRFQYDENDNIVAEIDALGGTVSHRYNRAGFRIASSDANGFESSTRYDSHGNPQESRDAEGRVATHIWGDNGELMLAIDGAGNKRRYEHDFQSNVIAETDAEGHTTRLVRDEKGRLVETRFSNGSVERRTWDTYNHVTSLTDAKGRTTSFDYDVFGRLVAATDPLGNVTRRTYDAGHGGFDAPSEIMRPDGVTMVRTFDAQGLLSVVRDGEGRAWRYRNGAFGVLEEITDPRGNTLRFGYDTEGRLLSVTNALGRVYRFSRDAAGRTVEEEDFDGRVMRYMRDAAGNVVQTLKPDGARLVNTYDKSGLVRRIDSFDPDGKTEDVTRFWYDARALLIRAENRAALVEFGRDKNGRVVSETLNGQRIKSSRDTMGQRILRDIVGTGGLTSYARDPLGQVEKLVADETTFTFSRDALGRETRRSTDKGFELSHRFDAVGQLIEQVVGGSRNPNRVSPFGINVPLAEASTEHAARRLYEYDRAFAPVRIDDALWGETKLSYDENGQVASSLHKAGEERFAYDPARNVAGASSGPSRAGTGGVSYRGMPLEEWKSTPGGVVQIARGPKGERVRLTHDACGRLIERLVERDGFRPRKWRYGWDTHDRLVSCLDPDGAEWLYRYDPFGRRVSKVRKFPEAERQRAALRWPSLVTGDGSPMAGGDGTPAKSANDNDGATADLAQTWHPNDLPAVGTAYLWDGDHMIAEAPLHLGGRIAWDKSTRWLFHENDFYCHKLLAKQLPAGAKLPDGTTLAEPTVFPIVCDQLGTPKEMFDDKGNLVWATDHHVWGDVRSTRTYGNLVAKPAHDRLPDTIACPWRFPGQYEDAETGLYYNRHRHYDPLTGQYASPDPIGLEGGDRPQGYVDVPLTSFDVLGLARSAELRARAWELQLGRHNGDEVLAKKYGTTSVMEVRNKITGERKIVVTSELSVAKGDSPAMYRRQLKQGEEYLPGNGHAEQTGIGNLGKDWEIVAGGTSRNICSGICSPLLRENGLTIGGPTFPGGPSATQYRQFWRDQ
ncbi:hypothetical protein MAUB1S_06378 [Mycolicibacterium aubagnense]